MIWHRIFLPISFSFTSLKPGQWLPQCQWTDLENDQHLIGPSKSNNEFTHQIWSQSDQQVTICQHLCKNYCAWKSEANKHREFSRAWPKCSLDLYSLTMSSPINSSPPGQNDHRFADDVFRCIFVYEKFCIFIRVSLKFVPKGPIHNKPALVQIMAWHRTDDKRLSEPMLTWFTDAYMQH